jgi:hypothetical protein
MRKKVIIQRENSRDEGTPGTCTIFGTSFTADSWELSDRGNASMISCIPFGFYVLRWTNHPQHGWCFQVVNVPGREDILFHSFNLAGNVESGFVKQALGCIGLGFGRGVFKAGTSMHVEGPNGLEVEALTRDQAGIINSKAAIAAFQAAMGTADADLEIRAPKLVLLA